MNTKTTVLPEVKDICERIRAYGDLLYCKAQSASPVDQKSWSRSAGAVLAGIADDLQANYARQAIAMNARVPDEALQEDGEWVLVPKIPDYARRMPNFAAGLWAPMHWERALEDLLATHPAPSAEGAPSPTSEDSHE